jgi:hypothetical protein
VAILAQGLHQGQSRQMRGSSPRMTVEISVMAGLDPAIPFTTALLTPTKVGVQLSRFVMRGLDPRISCPTQRDHRVKPGDDDCGAPSPQ